MRIKEFNRRELKYIFPARQIEAVVKDLRPYTEADPYATQNGGYHITSLYYDTPDYQCYWQKLNGVNHRRKLRVRIYGDSIHPAQDAYVEIKEKTDQVTRKRRMALPYRLTETFCRKGDLPDEYVDEKNQPLVDEIRHIAFSFQMQPACVVSYSRLALNGHGDYNQDLRITFDTYMRGRTYDLTLTSNCQDMSYFLPPTFCILEVKVDETLPHWLIDILARHELRSTPFSKYALTMQYGHTQLAHLHISMPKVLTRYG